MDRDDMQPARYRGIGAPKSVKERLDQVVWLLGYLDDMASDLSAIHGIRDMTQLSGPAFCKLAMRLTAYESVMRARVTALVNDNPQPAGGHLRRQARQGHGRRYPPPRPRCSPTRHVGPVLLRIHDLT